MYRVWRGRLCLAKGDTGPRPATVVELGRRIRIILVRSLDTMLPNPPGDLCPSYRQLREDVSFSTRWATSATVNVPRSWPYPIWIRCCQHRTHGRLSGQLQTMWRHLVEIVSRCSRRDAQEFPCHRCEGATRGVGLVKRSVPRPHATLSTEDVIN